MSTSQTLNSGYYELHDILNQQRGRTMSVGRSQSHTTSEHRPRVPSLGSVGTAFAAPTTNRPRNYSDSAFSPINNQHVGYNNVISYHQDPTARAQQNVNEAARLARAERIQSDTTGDRSPNHKINSSRYKTELCRPFEESGHCKYGDKCQFAHGAHECRTLARHPKYKTDLCRTYHTVGFCPYGPRCHFIHNEEERRLSMMNQSRSQSTSAVPPPISNSPTPIQRPRDLSFQNLNLNLYNIAAQQTGGQRNSLGSVSESPSSSIAADSPTASPTFLHPEDILSNGLNSLSLSTPPPPTAFPFPTSEDLPLLTPLSVETMDTRLNNLAAGIQQAANLREVRNVTNNNDMLSMDRQCMFFTPVQFSPQDSTSSGSMSSSSSISSSCGSPMELNKRLPIFSSLSQD